MQLIAFPEGSSTSLDHFLAVMKPMGIFLWIYMYSFNYYFRSPLSLVFCFPLKARPTLTAVSVWSTLGQGSLHGDRDTLHISKSSASKLGGWLVGDFAGYDCTSKPSKLWWPFGWSSALCSSHASRPQLHCHHWLPSLPVTGEWFQCSDPRSSGTGLWPLGRAVFFSDQDCCQHGSCPSTASGVSSHSGYPWAR